MPDREKLINELVEHIESALSVDSDYVDCVRTDLLQYTVALLKEQDARKGHWIEDETETYTENHDTWECSECHEPFILTEGTPEENKFYFCPRCGADMR